MSILWENMRVILPALDSLTSHEEENSPHFFSFNLFTKAKDYV